MDPASPTGCFNCSCSCCFESPSKNFRRCVKRKSDERESMQQAGFARVEIENELNLLRETLAGQQVAIQELSVELEEERNAAATATSETMSMMLRLQREKAEVQMEARQFRRFAEEKIAHDGREIAELEDLLFKREQQVQTLSCEVSAYRNRLLSLGVNVGSDPLVFPSDGDEGEFYLPGGVCYPPLRCGVASSCDDENMNLEQRIYELEKTPFGVDVNIFNPSPGNPKHFSDVDCLTPQETSTIVDGNGEDDDDKTDRICTIDAVHGVKVVDGSEDGEFIGSRLKGMSGEKEGFGGGEREEGDIKKLYMRLQALEADRESMRQAIISMRTEKAQIVLLREIAQQLCKDAKPERRIVKKKETLFGAFSVLSLIKWVIMPFLFWRKKASRSRYTFGLSNCNVGLLLLLDRSPQLSEWRCLTRTTPRRR